MLIFEPIKIFAARLLNTVKYGRLGPTTKILTRL